MKKTITRLSAAATVALMLIESSIYAFASTTAPKNMASAFEKIFDFLFRDSLDDFFKDLSGDNKVRAKTGILVVLFIIITALCLITIFSLDKKENEELDEDDEDEDEDELEDDDDDDKYLR